LFKEGGSIAESEGSQPYEVIARDVFPPASPTGLTALYTAGAVELVWTANSEKDLAGYYVYRREAGEQPVKLNKDELLRTPILRDYDARPGHVYYYHVTAVDLSNNESQPSEEVEVDTRN
jgi:fibronectin type 3 domain-containing protein